MADRHRTGKLLASTARDRPLTIENPGTELVGDGKELPQERRGRRPLAGLITRKWLEIPPDIDAHEAFVSNGLEIT
jgi:hypothetical protein